MREGWEYAEAASSPLQPQRRDVAPSLLSHWTPALHSLLDRLPLNFTGIPLLCVSMAMPVRANKETLYFWEANQCVRLHAEVEVAARTYWRVRSGSGSATFSPRCFSSVKSGHKWKKKDTSPALVFDTNSAKRGALILCVSNIPNSQRSEEIFRCPVCQRVVGCCEAGNLLRCDLHPDPIWPQLDALPFLCHECTTTVTETVVWPLSHSISTAQLLSEEQEHEYGTSHVCRMSDCDTTRVMWDLSRGGND